MKLTLVGGVCGLDDGGEQDHSNCGSRNTYDGHMDEQRIKIRMWIHKQTVFVFRRQSVFSSCYCLCRYVFSKFHLLILHFLKIYFINFFTPFYIFT